MTGAKTKHMPRLLIEPRPYNLFRIQNANPFFFFFFLRSAFLSTTPFLLNRDPNNLRANT